MRRIILFVTILLTIGSATAQQQSGFVTVDGATLAARIDSAVRLGNSRGAKFWTGYSFDVRAGICIDNDWKIVKNRDDKTPCDTRNVGIFLLRDPGTNSIVKAQVYNLDRNHDFGGNTVYWLGKATSRESLDFLRILASSDQDVKVAEHSIMAISFHDDALTATLLEGLIHSLSNQKLRSTSVFWLGQTPGHHPLLGELARNEEENIEV